MAQELGVLLMQRRGVEVVCANGDNLTATDDPSRVMMRQVAGAFAEYEKARLVQKLRGARDHKSAIMGKRVEGRRGYAETDPAMVEAAKHMAAAGWTQRRIAADLDSMGFGTRKGTAISSGQVCRILTAAGWPPLRAR